MRIRLILTRSRREKIRTFFAPRKSSWEVDEINTDLEQFKDRESPVERLLDVIAGTQVW